MKKPKLLLLDANVVIHLFELGIWTEVITRHKVHLAKTVVEQEARYYEDTSGTRHYIDLSDDIDAGRIQVFEESPSHLMAFRDSFDPSYVERLDAGETESLVHLLRETEDCRICSADKIVFRILGKLLRSEQGISLEEVLDQMGFGRPLARQYSKAYREEWTRRGFAESLGGLGRR